MTAPGVEAAGAAILLGLVLGLQHATDPDHLVAVGTIVSRERRFTAGVAVGLLWGLGHMLTLAVAGSVVLALDVRLGPAATAGLELVVAALLVALGLSRLHDLARDLDAVPREHLLADHDHDGGERVHRHPHAHGDGVHAHTHVHPSRRLLAALAAGGTAVAGRAVVVGAVHGLAGTAAVSLLVLATVPTGAGAVAYLAAFGLGTLAGMTALTAAMAWPVSLALRARRTRRALAAGAGLGSIAFGVLYALRAV